MTGRDLEVLETAFLETVFQVMALQRFRFFEVMQVGIISIVECSVEIDELGFVG
jgi:hypothetical protein